MTRLILVVLAVQFGGCTAEPSSGHNDQQQAFAQSLHPPDVRYEPSPQRVVKAMLQLANVTRTDVVYDLGSGDGLIPIAAAREHGARAVGIEIDPALLSRATDNARKAGVAARVTFRNEDLFSADIGDATVVTLFLSPQVNLKLQPKLINELRPGARIVSHYHDMGDWKPDRTIEVLGRPIYLWTVSGSKGQIAGVTPGRAWFGRSLQSYARLINEPDDTRIMAAMGAVPRHNFVPPSLRAKAYEDRPLPIGHDQTISQPSLVALMTHLLRPDHDDVVLEVGTGSGYQAAILSRLVDKVYSIEILEPLAKEAQQRLRRLGYHNVTVKHGDGYLGWPEHAPFDGIIVTAGAPHVPDQLLQQLKPGGLMVIPVGPAYSTQQLKLVRKGTDGSVREERIIPVGFVPLTRNKQKR
ncbi:protein-L-isoaspartate(D-aspartate) O-methyltransferase [Rhizorhapis sp.]|uniref:protein-L-isoaspartate(D-aspartate) O-methyltransferase n=1 Tax=Rhizorhapis sp. TaxID=1968842 RepID=UPI002B49EC9B|nr:protein-L-isoaspartate(D-aspartate) O-methyltransferase [Rhizorhapis sp.]HKR15839.1 protein-L-isoaspartate(D-aspartate) O-methyltransferase [Rhizorhapis sp.]